MNVALRNCELFSSARKVASVAGFFVAVGPPVGGTLWMVLGAVGGTVLKGFLNFGAIKVVFGALLIGLAGMPYSFVFGVPPALLAGVAVGVAQISYGPLHPLVVLAIGAAVGICDIAIFKETLRLVGASASPNIFLCVLTCAMTTYLGRGFIQNWYLPDVRSEGASS